MKPVEELTYDQAITELDAILRTIQSDKCDIDKLSEMTRRATQLLTACRAKLTTTETELKQILSTLSE